MKVAILGKHHQEDYPKQWDIRLLPSLGEVHHAYRYWDDNQVGHVLKQLDGVDLAIYATTGVDLVESMPVLVNDPETKDLFAVKRRALWVLDDFNLRSRDEHEWANHFTSVYSSHPHRLGIASRFLPPCITDMSATALADTKFDDAPPPISISCLNGPCMALDKTILPVLQKYHLSFLFGKAEPFSTNLTLVRNSQVTLNGTYHGVMHPRCFEAMAMNRVLLTNRFAETEMHDCLKIFENSVVYYDHAANNFEASLQEAVMRVPTKDTRKLVAERHCLAHRHMTIAKNELGGDDEGSS